MRSLLIILILVCVSYTGFWFYQSDKIKTGVVNATQASLAYETIEVKGYPFAFDVVVSKPIYTEIDNGTLHTRTFQGDITFGSGILAEAFYLKLPKRFSVETATNSQRDQVISFEYDEVPFIQVTSDITLSEWLFSDVSEVFKAISLSAQKFTYKDQGLRITIDDESYKTEKTLCEITYDTNGGQNRTHTLFKTKAMSPNEALGRQHVHLDFTINSEGNLPAIELGALAKEVENDLTMEIEISQAAFMNDLYSVNSGGKFTIDGRQLLLPRGWFRLDIQHFDQWLGHMLEQDALTENVPVLPLLLGGATADNHEELNAFLQEAGALSKDGKRLQLAVSRSENGEFLVGNSTWTEFVALYEEHMR